jgi:UDP-glucose 4-epimerase|tara:strand:- start:909 stop:1868 length:960 start_codon:yes stop_codon:yes gene_type:complete
MKNILITGGLGYLGGRIANYLQKNEPGTTITLGTRRPKERIPAWAKSYRSVPLDLLKPGSLPTALVGIDTLIHLAAVNESESFETPEKAWQVNTLGTQLLLEEAVKKGVERVIYFSTFHVYSPISGEIITEKTVTRPTHPYASTHRAAEDIVAYFAHYKSMKTLTLRLSNGFGYPMDEKIDCWSLIFNDLCRQAVTTKNLVLKSSGRQHRDFITLNDIGRAVHHFLMNIPDKWGDGLYNLGGERSMSILGAAKKVAEVFERKTGGEIQTLKTESKIGSAQLSPVHFSIKKLKQTGFRLEGNIDREIEQTLTLCESFLKK